MTLLLGFLWMAFVTALLLGFVWAFLKYDLLRGLGKDDHKHPQPGE